MCAGVPRSALEASQRLGGDRLNGTEIHHVLRLWLPQLQLKRRLQRGAHPSSEIAAAVKKSARLRFGSISRPRLK